MFLMNTQVQRFAKKIKFDCLFSSFFKPFTESDGERNGCAVSDFNEGYIAYPFLAYVSSILFYIKTK